MTKKSESAAEVPQTMNYGTRNGEESTCYQWFSRRVAADAFQPTQTAFCKKSIAQLTTRNRIRRRVSGFPLLHSPLALNSNSNANANAVGDDCLPNHYKNHKIDAGGTETIFVLLPEKYVLLEQNYCDELHHSLL